MTREQIIFQQLKEWAEKQETNPAPSNPFTEAYYEGVNIAKAQALLILNNPAQ